MHVRINYSGYEEKRQTTAVVVVSAVVVRLFRLMLLMHVSSICINVGMQELYGCPEEKNKEGPFPGRPLLSCLLAIIRIYGSVNLKTKLNLGLCPPAYRKDNKNFHIFYLFLVTIRTKDPEANNSKYSWSCNTLFNYDELSRTTVSTLSGIEAFVLGTEIQSVNQGHPHDVFKTDSKDVHVLFEDIFKTS